MSDGQMPGNEPSGSAVRESAKDEERAPPSPRKKALTRSFLMIGALAVLIGGGIWLYDWWTHGRFVESTNDAYLQADQISVSTRVSGFVDQVLVADNEEVHAGQLLVKLDDRDPKARLEQAKAAADQARASIAQAEAQISQQDAQIAERKAQLENAQAEQRFAEKQAKRYTALAATGAETDEREDQMRHNLDQARTEVVQAAAAVLAAQRLIDTYRAQIGQAEAQIEQAQAQARQAQVDLDATLVRASIDGRIGDRTVRLGQYVQASTRMMTVVPVQNLYLTANFKETQIGRMRVGQPVTISVDALDGEELKGVVDSFSPGTGAQFALIPPNNATGNFTKIVQRVPVRILVQASAAARKVLVPGLSVTAKVDTSRLPAGENQRVSTGENGVQGAAAR